MKRGMLVAALVVLASPLALLSAGGKGAVSGEYVEARTAEVFTGGCIMGSEAETVGRNAVLAWKVNQGSFNGVSLDGLTVVAAIAGDKNLGIGEIGGGKATTRSAVFVDSRESALAYFEQMIANIRDPLGYAVWLIPVWSARVP